MAALSSPSRRRRWSVAGAALLALLLPLLSVAETTPEPPAPIASGAASQPTVEALLAEARSALEQADLEIAEKLARQAAEQAESREQVAAALDLIAQCLFILGDAEGTAEAIDRLVEHLPSYEVSGEIVGPKYVELYRSRREKKVGFFAPVCKPLPCERYLVDGAEVRAGAGGELAVTAGAHTVRLLRHGFEPWESSAEMEIAAGEHKVIEVELRQVARDLVLQTVPPGVEVLIDGRVVGRTRAAEDDPEAGRFEMRELSPGEHLLVLRRECYQRLEQRVEIVLDALDPGPLDLGRIELQPARAELDLRWDRPAGLLSLDGRQVDPGPHELCPGRHRLELQLAGKRSWFEEVELSSGERRVLEVRPRPTLALAPPVLEALGAAAADGWNQLVLDADLAARWHQRVTRGGRSAPPYPSIERRRVEIGDLALPPGIDLLVMMDEDREAIPATRRLLLFDPVTGMLEQTAWPLAESEQALAVAAAQLAPAQPAAVAFVGFDVAGRLAGPPVITEVHPACPVEGLAPGELLLDLDGRALDARDPVRDLARRLAALEPGEAIKLRVQTAEGPLLREGKVLAQVEPPNPYRLGTHLLLPRLAAARSVSATAQGQPRFLAALEEGMILAALGLDQQAARLLDRTEIPADLDPSTDLRGTVWTVLESLLRRVGAAEYAAEVHARLASLGGARFGGRQGPPLSYATGTPLR